ncbi:hypothetical protein [Bacillus sp. ISL-57]|uniref:hypothetical protein n=1 Tax=Bacillus sp. ISL-57 TaxID=2819135 RepID=UPI001BE80958|nr:hypothetical protein [Bacillus sp. ISL-57]MBT2717563.1 hypothetical protein [Bacillus sp. ISL-57]
MDELLDRVLVAVGKTREEYDREVEEQKGKSLINQDVSSLAEVTAFLIVNTETMAQVNAELMKKVFEMEQRIEELEGNVNA